METLKELWTHLPDVARAAEKRVGKVEREGCQFQALRVDGWQKLICGMADPADRRMCTTVETA